MGGGVALRSLLLILYDLTAGANQAWYSGSLYGTSSLAMDGSLFVGAPLMKDKVKILLYLAEKRERI